MDVRRIAVVGYDGAELIDIACVTTSLGMVSEYGRARVPYRTVLLTPGGRPISLPTGLSLQGGQPLERVTGPFDTVLVSGGLGHEKAAGNPLIVAHVRRLARESRRIASICTGAGILAAAGLLEGRRVTTHWRYATELAARHPEVTVDADPIYIRDGNVITSAGVTSALDLSIALIEEDHGAEMARLIARHLVIYLQRPGNQAQMSIFTAAPPPGNDVVRGVVEHVLAGLDGDLSAAALAARAGISVRHLTRLFLAHLGRTPGQYVRHARLEAAAHLLAGTSLPMPAVAARCGFGSAETLRQAFTTRYGIAPSRYRQVHGGQ
ncbi:GlxA family transcriptional regulator [Nonomuraea wenchangensis]|uniref:Transcriptional regulator GlxA family, contains an amidase domain and an AraC-type DNA-binding HTH domain n=1 Tax=Nonomuraea wenchangensis TaxID=568860 RepID=A0A1I0KC05_9ACTN|nr:helix-turn-helix domain-containing protein [Nonomuraea wenchangensis]SEU21574.1 Transcriptional regulator GlxA family, contains an amidase domain and an AraC-type DNA-binding HTH domain [Nonomuraea wenchangensis]